MPSIAFRLSALALLALASCGKPAGNSVSNTLADNAMSDFGPSNDLANDLVAVPEDNDSADMGNGDTAGAATLTGWIGRWTGPEGLFLDISPADDGKAGDFKLVIKDNLDSKGDAYVGAAKGETIRFERAGKAETIRAGSGAETGFKYLMDKQDCLIVQAGKEGYCR